MCVAIGMLTVDAVLRVLIEVLSLPLFSWGAATKGRARLFLIPLSFEQRSLLGGFSTIPFPLLLCCLSSKSGMFIAAQSTIFSLAGWDGSAAGGHLKVVILLVIRALTKARFNTGRNKSHATSSSYSISTVRGTQTVSENLQGAAFWVARKVTHGDERMLEDLAGCDPLSRVHHQHLCHQIQKTLLVTITHSGFIWEFIRLLWEDQNETKR